MIILKCYIWFMALLGYAHVNNGSIVVIGEAQNAKAGGLVISRDDKKMYYLDGINYWGQNMVGKIIRVSGKLQIENKELQKKDEPVKQQITGIKRIILKPKWELVK
jgi:hypothetical protein